MTECLILIHGIKSQLTPFQLQVITLCARAGFCYDCRVIRSALLRWQMSMFCADGVLRNSVIIIGGQRREIRKIVLLNSLSFSHVSCKFLPMCWHSFISVPVSETYLCLAGHVGKPFSPRAVLLRASSHHYQPIFYYPDTPNTKVWWIFRVWRRMCVSLWMWDQDVPSAVTNIQLQELAGLLVNQAISTRLIGHVWHESSASGTQIYWIIRNETDFHTDNYLSQQESSVCARAYLRLSV